MMWPLTHPFRRGEKEEPRPREILKSARKTRTTYRPSIIVQWSISFAWAACPSDCTSASYRVTPRHTDAFGYRNKSRSFSSRRRPLAQALLSRPRNRMYWLDSSFRPMIPWTWVVARAWPPNGTSREAEIAGFAKRYGWRRVTTKRDSAQSSINSRSVTEHFGFPDKRTVAVSAARRPQNQVASWSRDTRIAGVSYEN